MKRFLFFSFIGMFLLSACQSMEPVTVAPNPHLVTPSRPPTILTITPFLVQPSASNTSILIPSETPTVTVSPAGNATATFTPAFTNTASATSSPTLTELPILSQTATSTPQVLDVELLGCETGVDVSHAMGEVTNAYVSLINALGPEQSGVCVTLSSSDEGRAHPDKTVCIPSLPHGYMVTIKPTIDTSYKADTKISLEIGSDEGLSIKISDEVCQGIGSNKPAAQILNLIQPIP